MRTLNLMSRSEVCILKYNLLAKNIIDDRRTSIYRWVFCMAHASSIPKTSHAKEIPTARHP
jgi:hypothetical protein